MNSNESAELQRICIFIRGCVAAAGMILASVQAFASSTADTLWLGNNGLTANTPIENRDTAGTLLRSFQAPGLGLAIDEASARLFVSGSRNPISVYELASLTLIESISQSPNLFTGSDLSFDGIFLYRADPSTTSVYRINVATGASSQFIVGLANPIGLAWDGSHHYIVEAGGGILGGPRVSRYTSSGVATGEQFALNTFNSGSVAGLAFDTSDSTLWLGSIGSVYHLSTTGTILGSFSTGDSRIVHGLEYQATAPIPEPHTYILFSVGLIGLALLRLRRRAHRTATFFDEIRNRPCFSRYFR